MKFFQTGDDVDPLYRRIRDSRELDCPELKGRIEEMWARWSPFCGDGSKSFVTDAQKKFGQAAWEMYLGCLLLEHGFTLENPGRSGVPDFKLITDNGPIWIEAVAPTAGDPGPDQAVREVFEEHEVEGVPEEFVGHVRVGRFRPAKDQTVLRYTGALASKLEQRGRRVATGKVGATDPYIVAINGGQIDDAFMWDGPHPDILRAVYPIGDPVWLVNVPLEGELPDDERIEERISYRGEVRKGNDSPVRTNAFLDESYAGISAVLFSSNDIVNAISAGVDGLELITVHNVLASMPIPAGTFRLGHEFVVTLQERGTVFRVAGTRHGEVASEPVAGE